MKKISGRIRNFDEEERTFEIYKRNKIEHFYLSRTQVKKFGTYLKADLFVELQYVDEPKKRNKFMAYDVMGFDKLIEVGPHKRTIYFDMNTIRNGVAKVLERKGNKMFIDLEFSMPPYNHKQPFICEIVQYGFIIENEEGEIIQEHSSRVMPTDPKGINSRVLDFLKIDKDDFNNAATPLEFYQTLKETLEEYQPIIMVWGTNDILMLNNFYALHNLEPLTSRASFINLMQLLKNYYGVRSDIGLFNALTYFDKTFTKEQDHDALEDAMITSLVYHEFKNHTKTNRGE